MNTPTTIDVEVFRVHKDIQLKPMHIFKSIPPVMAADCADKVDYWSGEEVGMLHTILEEANNS